MTDRINPYADIIDLPHHQSADRPHMSLYNRAAQFSPYAALVGFDGVIAETGRLTERRMELSDWEKADIDRMLARIGVMLDRGEHPVIEATVFVPDPRKEGGMYRVFTGKVKRISCEERLLRFYAGNGISNGEGVEIDSIQALRWVRKEGSEHFGSGEEM